MKTSRLTETSPAAADKRGAPRRRVVSFGLVVPDADHPGLDCTIRDVSIVGARIGFARNVRLPESFWLIDVRSRHVHHCTLAWRNDLEAGLRFHDSFTLAQITEPRLLFLKVLWLQHATR